MEIKDWLLLAGLFVTFLVGLIGAIPALRKSRSDVNSINAETILKLSDEVDDFVDYKVRVNERFAKMDNELYEVKKELRTYKNAFARAIKFIHELNPHAEIPNFFETNPNAPGAK